MRSLLDVNVLVSLFDERHVHNKIAHDWLSKNLKRGWASCPITENGLLRILSNPNYSRFNRYSVEDISSLLGGLSTGYKPYVLDGGISILEEAHFDCENVLEAKQLTDVYLLSLAAELKGRFVTFDSTIAKKAFLKSKISTLHIIDA